MSDRRELSMRLNDVLEMVGVTEEMRSYHRRNASRNEIIQMVFWKRNGGVKFNWHQCGSSTESTLTPDLASDFDVIHCSIEPLVVPHRLMAGPGRFLLMVRDEETRPGYVKLQLMRDGEPLTVYNVEERDKARFDREGMICVRHAFLGTRHGPANMVVDEFGNHVTDHVFAFQCKGIPLFATEWITRRRQYDWPSQQLIDELRMMGCIFVGVGHFESREKDFEWRLSFSRQERMMMSSLNITQHRVYVILKMIKNDILAICFNGESLSSYHCKTCVFYMVETTPASMWVPENTIDCLLQCLTLLLKWIKDRLCPSFFLKESNLFDKDGFERLTDPLEKILTLLLQTGHEFLYLLQSDSVGEMLRYGELIVYKPVSDCRLNKYIYDIDYKSICRIVSAFRSVSKAYSSAQDSLSSYISELEELQHADCCPGYTEEEYKNAVCLALPWLHLSIGLEFAARAVSCPDRHEAKELMKKVDCHLQQAMDTDLVNVRLAQATILLRLEKLEECVLLLQEIQNSWRYHVSIHCPCIPRGSHVFLDMRQHGEVANECRNISLRNKIKTRFASCVIFERSQIDLLPEPLRYEMYRSLCTHPGSRNKKDDAWFDRAAVDPKVYLYLLQYMVCSKLNRQRHMQVAMDNLAYVTLPEIPIHSLSHRETAFNLLGWVYLQEHRVADAVWCFLQSWRIRPHHNAAKFHVLVESFKQSQSQSLQQNDT